MVYNGQHSDCLSLTCAAPAICMILSAGVSEPVLLNNQCWGCHAPVCTVRLHAIGSLESMHDWYLLRCLMRALRILCKRSRSKLTVGDITGRGRRRVAAVRDGDPQLHRERLP